MTYTELFTDILKLASQKGFEFTELYFEDHLSQSVKFANNKVENISSGQSRGVGIRVISENSAGYAYTSELTKKALTETLEAAGYLASKATKNPTEVNISPLETSTEKETQIPLRRQVELIQTAQDSAQLSNAIAQINIVLSTGQKNILILNSEGLIKSQTQQRTHFSTRIVASGDSGLQTGYEVIARVGNPSFLTENEVAQISKKAAEMALIKLQAQPVPTGEMPVVLAKGSGGILFHEACGHGLEADHILKGASQFCNRLNTRVAPEYVTLVDDPTVEGYWGTLEIDDEGNNGSCTTLIKDGLLVGYMADRLRAKHFNLRPANGRRQSYKHPPMVRMTNTFIKPSNLEPQEIIQDTKYGIYVSKLSGGQVNTTTGDFVFGILEAYLIKDGEIKTPLREANLIGNGLNTLSLIDAVGNDFDMSPGTCGKDGQQVPVGCGMPTLRVSKLTVGGTSK